MRLSVGKTSVITNVPLDKYQNASDLAMRIIKSIKATAKDVND